LVRNRLEFAARLDSAVVIMHAGEPDPADPAPFWDAIRRSLDELEPAARTLGVRIAVENGQRTASWETLATLLGDYPPDFLGLCYDSGHGNMLADGLARLDALRDRLIAVHLHDNDGGSDQHRIPFTGTVSWDRLAQVLARSSYTDMVNIETIMHQTGLTDQDDFLAQTYTAAHRVELLIRDAAVAGGG
jgi:sugar phosphate isomerase/epimerase